MNWSAPFFGCVNVQTNSYVVVVFCNFFNKCLRYAQYEPQNICFWTLLYITTIYKYNRLQNNCLAPNIARVAMRAVLLSDDAFFGHHCTTHSGTSDFTSQLVSVVRFIPASFAGHLNVTAMIFLSSSEPIKLRRRRRSHNVSAAQRQQWTCTTKRRRALLLSTCTAAHRPLPTQDHALDQPVQPVRRSSPTPGAGVHLLFLT